MSHHKGQGPKKLLDRLRTAFPVAVFLITVAALYMLGLAPRVGPIRTEFVIFAMIIGGIALFHDKAFMITLAGLSGIVLYKYLLIGSPMLASEHFAHSEFADTPAAQAVLTAATATGLTAATFLPADPAAFADTTPHLVAPGTVTSSDPVAKLNAVIRDETMFARWTATGNRPDAAVLALAQQTSDLRTRAYAQLNPDEQKQVRMLNRLIIEQQIAAAPRSEEMHFSLLHHLRVEWRILVNLFGLLLGFGLLAKHFEESNVVAKLVRVLPDGVPGCFLLLALVWFISSFLDNIAAALIGGTIALIVFRKQVHIGYVAGIVAASNAGGAWSVLGDTTTTLMWIAGVSPLNVAHGIIASVVALAISGLFAAIQQNRHHALQRDNLHLPGTVDYGKVAIVALVLAGAIIANFALDFPAVGVWAALFIGATFRPTTWGEVKNSLPGSFFLMMLVTCASLMPVRELPDPSAQTAFILGAVSAVFDNIPLTALAIKQGFYDWGMLAFTVGFGGSMIWFGSSAGVAITTMFPQARSVGSWLRGGWHVALAYVIAFAVMYYVMGWEPMSIAAAGD